MSEADSIVWRKFEISAATPNNSHISLRNELKIELKKLAKAEEQNDLDETPGKQQEKATEEQENLSTSQKAENTEPRDPEEGLDEFHSLESSGDTEVRSFSSCSVQKKFNQGEEQEFQSPSEEDLRPQEGWGDTKALSARSSFLSCSSYEQLRKSILNRERHTSTLSVRSLADLDYDLKTTLSGLRVSYCSSASSVMKGRSLSLTPNNSDRAIGFDVNKNCWPYFRRSDIDSALAVFKQVDEDKNGYISLCELKRFLEILEMPQTHLKTKKMMSQVVRGSEDRLNFGEALLIYGSLKHRLVPLKWRHLQLETGEFIFNDEIDVAQVGVSGAKLFFEAKIALQTPRYPREIIKSRPEVVKKPQSEP